MVWSEPLGPVHSRLAYRNFTTYQSLVVTASVLVSGTKRGQVDGMRWYELRIASAGATPTVYQQATFSPDSNSRWMGSIAMDKNGDMALGYSLSSSSVYPSIRYTGRLSTDALNTMESESTILTGAHLQTGSLNRWGDYSPMQVDPVDGCTFWYTNEYLPATGSFN